MARLPSEPRTDAAHAPVGIQDTPRNRFPITARGPKLPTRLPRTPRRQFPPSLYQHDHTARPVRRHPPPLKGQTPRSGIAQDAPNTFSHASGSDRLHRRSQATIWPQFLRYPYLTRPDRSPVGRNRPGRRSLSRGASPVSPTRRSTLHRPPPFAHSPRRSPAGTRRGKRRCAQTGPRLRIRHHRHEFPSNRDCGSPLSTFTKWAPHELAEFHRL